MFLLTRPSDEQIDNIIAAQRAASLTYSFEGVTRNGSPPAGYAVDHNKVRLGAGQATFERAVAAMRRWDGTLGVHMARGEERFLVEWDRADDAVWYSILAFSRPKSLLAWLGYPVARLMQRRFAAASKRAMVRAVNA